MDYKNKNQPSSFLFLFKRNIKTLLKEFITKSSINTINQYFYFLRDFFVSTEDNDLFKKGLLIKKNYLESSYMDKFSKYFSFDNLDFANKRTKLSDTEARELLTKLSEVINTKLKSYLGSNLYCTEYDAVMHGKQTSTDGSYQPHHDQRGRRIKIFIYIKDSEENSHPLYYLIGSNKKFKRWSNYQATRFENLNKNEMTKFFGKKGDVALFDTHGLHSHNKISTGSRCILKLVIENFSLFNKLIDRSRIGKNYLKKNNAIKIDFT